MKQITREFVGCCLWTAAIVVMIFGTVDTVHAGHNTLALPWGIFLAAVAHQVTSWAIIRRHHDEQEVSVERIVEIVDALHTDHRQPSRLR